jgi:hypothetical protein
MLICVALRDTTNYTVKQSEVNSCLVYTTYMDEVPAITDTPQVKEETILAWSSPSRIFKKRDKEYFTNIGAIVFLLIVILIFAREYMFILAVLSIVFFIYVMSTVPPEEVQHKITNLGIESAGHFYRYDTLFEFWFDSQWGQTMIAIKPITGSRIIMLLGTQEKQTIQDILSKHIPFREQPEKSWVDNAARWITEKIPLEKPAS